MREKAGEDVYLVASRQAPLGLVSEPADYPACVAALKTLMPPAGSKPARVPGATELTRKCGELYAAIKEQALEYVVSSYWSFNFYAPYGVTVSEAETRRVLARIEAEQYPREGKFQRYLASHRRTVAQELLIIKNNILATKINEKLFSRGARVLSALEKAFNASDSSAICSPGYVVKYCRGYQPSTASVQHANARSPGVLLEEIVR